MENFKKLILFLIASLAIFSGILIFSIHSAIATNHTQTTDKCAGVTCGPLTTTCPDGFKVSCTPVCDPNIGACGTCTPDCSGHTATQPTCPASQTCPDGKTTVACKLVNNVCTCDQCPTTTACPTPPPQPTCSSGTILKTNYDANKCITGYECVSTTTAVCGNKICESGETSASCPSDCPSSTPVTGYCGWCGDSCTRITSDTVCAAIIPPSGFNCVEENGVCVKKAYELPKQCPLAPVELPVCGPDEGVKSVYNADGCVVGYQCVVATTGTAVCPQVPPPTITCPQGQELSKTTDDRGCVVGYYCAGGPTVIEACPSVVAKPECRDGTVAPLFDRGCLIAYTCVPQGCRQETDPSGFVRVTCEQAKVCPADIQQAELKATCFAQGGNPVPFSDPSGCTFYDCRFDDREIKPNPFSGHLTCPAEEERKKMFSQCEASGLSPTVTFEGGCKIVKCGHYEKPVCRYTAESEVNRVESQCRSQGLPTIKDIDNNGCVYFRCGETPNACPREVPPEAYTHCDSAGGEMIVKTNEQGCIIFSQCVLPGDESHAYVKPVEEVPSTTALLNLALKLEQLKIELDKLSAEADEIAKYYASAGSLDEERFNRVSAMFAAASDKVDEIKTEIRDNLDTLTKDDLLEIRHDINYLKEVTLKDILYLMLSNSEDVRETLELSKKISTESNLEDIERNAKDCGTDGFCFDRAIRSCKPVTFKPEGRHGPSISIVGLKDEACVMRVVMPEDKIPPGFTRENFFMECAIPDYAIGIRGPQDVIPHCEGPMAEFAKKHFGGSGEISGASFPPPEGGPGGCQSIQECALYCVDNYDECREWTEEHPAYGPIPSREELRRFASGEFKEREGYREEFKHREFNGPGGCKGPEECERFCRNNPEECMRWCDENPDICPKGRAIEPPEEFRRGAPGEFGPQPISRAPSLPEGVQACVGCLNNGICDIGECSECIDCLKVGR